MIVVRTWEARLLGVLPMRHAGRTDHRCQACGARFTLHPWLLPWFVAGVAFGGAALGTGALGLVGSAVALAVNGPAPAAVVLVTGGLATGFGVAQLVFLAGPQVHAWRNPIVPGAPAPALRDLPPDDHRRCTCGAAVAPHQLGARTMLRLPAGTSARYLCPACGRRFTIESPLSLVTWAAATVLVGGIALFLALLLPFSELRADHFVVLGFLGLLAMGTGTVGALGLALRWRHPPA